MAGSTRVKLPPKPLIQLLLSQIFNLPVFVVFDAVLPPLHLVVLCKCCSIELLPFGVIFILL
jgi:hypothetical protein